MARRGTSARRSAATPRTLGERTLLPIRMIAGPSGGHATSAPTLRRWGRVDRPATIVIGNSSPLAACTGQDAHGVVVGLGQHGLGDPAALGGLLAHPLEVLAQRAVGGVGPGRAWSSTNRTRRHRSRGRPSAGPARAGAGREPRRRPARSASATTEIVHPPEVGEPTPHRIVVGHRVGAGRRWSRTAAVIVAEPEEVVVTAAEQRVISGRRRRSARRSDRRWRAA